MNSTIDGVGGFLADVFGGLLGDVVKQWRNRNLINSLAKTKEHLDKLGIPVENAKALPMGELYAIFEGMSKQDDPNLSDMWSALLANAMDPTKKIIIDPSLPKILEQMSGVDAVVLKFYSDSDTLHKKITAENTKSTQTLSSEELAPYQTFIHSEGENIRAQFPDEILSASIENLLRLGLLYVDLTPNESFTLVKAEIDRDYEVRVDVSELQDELSNIYYHMKTVANAGDDHQLIHTHKWRETLHHSLPYDITRTSVRLIDACTARYPN